MNKKKKIFVFIGFSNKYVAFIPEFFNYHKIENIKQISYNDFMQMINKEEIHKAFLNPEVLKNKKYKFFKGYFNDKEVIICKENKIRWETYFIEVEKN